MGGPERTILAIGGGVLAVVLVAIGVVLVFGSSDIEQFPPDSPPGTVQRYLNSLRERDYDTAEALLSARVRRQFTTDEFRRVSFCPTQDGRRVRVLRTDESDTHATVVLSIEQISGTGVQFERYSYEHPVSLVWEDGVWKIDDAYLCV
ncbi:MAG TPA: hypothetical protein VMM78_06325 [Thermomicrobiales bacterium]|nr:hypothetical protein [Thermomicrobiales bacterium]